MEHYVLITGATNGLGLTYAKQFAGKGYNLVMTSRRREVIEERAQETRDKYTYKVTVVLVDLASGGGIRKLLAPLEDREAHVLVSNAGFGFRTSFSDTDIDELKRLTYLQITAVAEITHRVLRGTKERNKDVIINISSDGAFAVVPGSVTYAASKRFIATLAERLHMELMGAKIRVQAVCPGFVDTGSRESDGVHMDKTRKGMFGFRQPEDVVDEAIKKFEKGKAICILNKAGKLVKAMAKYMPKRIYCRFINDFVNKSIRKDQYVAALARANIRMVLTSTNTNKYQY